MMQRASARFRRRRRYGPPPPGTDLEQLAGQHRRAVVSMTALDGLPVEIRLALKDCPFPVDIQRAPRLMDWAQVRERIAAVRTFEDACALDKWLLHVGLRYRR